MKLFETDFYVTGPTLSIHVPSGTGETVHKNRPSHGFAFFASGVCSYTFEDTKTLTCRKGDLIYMPQGSSYTVALQNHTDGAAKSVFAINFLISSDERFEPFKISLKNPAKIGALFEAAERTWVNKGPGYKDAVFSSLYQILLLLKKEYHKSYYGSKYKTLISPAIDYIGNHYTFEKISVEKLAALCGISVSYLRRLFGCCYGVSPVEYITSLRLVYARELLCSGEFSVTAAAEHAGFNDISYFSRTFKAHFGMSPANLIKNER